jgi:hypothetical protein
VQDERPVEHVAQIATIAAGRECRMLHDGVRCGALAGDDCPTSIAGE